MPRPSSFAQETADIICLRLAEGESLRAICASPDMPNRSTVFRWLEASEPFRDQYARAREAQADYYAEEIIEISDDGSRDVQLDGDGNERVDHEVVARSRLRVDARKWFASKVAPKKYGDRVMNEHTGKDGDPIKVEDVSSRDLAKALLGVLGRAADEKQEVGS